MLRYIITSLLVHFSLLASGQGKLLFHENFDAPSKADSVFNNPYQSGMWSRDSTLSVSGNSSYHIDGDQGISGSFTTANIYIKPSQSSPFSPPYMAVRLKFKQIGKMLSPYNRGIVEYSTTNGYSWNTLPESSYLGSSTSYLYTFDDKSYPDWRTGTFATPDSTWWKPEEFLIHNIPHTSDSIRFRFTANFTTYHPGPDPYAAGWYIDDILVYGDSCENDRPTLTLHPNYNCVTSIGPVLRDSTGGHNISVIANDYTTKHGTGYGSGVDSVMLYYSINGGSFLSQKMQYSSNLLHRYNIVGVYPGDTVRWYVEAEDRCQSGIVRLPETQQTYFTFWPVASGRCQLPNCQRLNTIASFPYYENFEGPQWQASNNGGRGNFPQNVPVNWTLAPNANISYGWGVQSSSFNIQAGPAKDHTSGSGKYLFARSNGQFALNTATFFTSPCIDLGDSIPKAFSFYYHAYGSDLGELKIHVDTGLNTPSYWSGYLKLKGEQQTSSADPWRKAYVDLSPFIGKNINLKINYVKTKTGINQNFAIDDLAIENLHQYDAAPLELLSPSVNGCNTSPAVVSVSVLNIGSQPLSQIPLAYSYGSTIYRDTLFPTTPLASMATDTLAFSLGINLGFNTEKLKVWCELQGDNNAENDTLIHIISPQTPLVNTFPIFIDFENATIGNSGIASELNNPNFFIPTDNSTQDSIQWTVNQGSIIDKVQSPKHALGKSGKYLTFSDYNTSSGTEYLEIRSTCLDISSLTNPLFSMAAYIPSNHTAELWIKGDTSSWAKVTSFTPPSTLKSRDYFRVYKFSLSSWNQMANYAGQNIRLALRTKRSGEAYNIYIDNIEIGNGSLYDYGIAGVEPMQHALLTTQANFDFKIIANQYSGASQSSASQLNVQMEFKQICDTFAASITTPQASITLNAGNITTAIDSSYSFTVPSNLSPGRYACKAWTNHPQDINNLNDTLYFELTVQEPIDLPYFNDFETCENLISISGEYSQWQITTPQKTELSSAYSGNKSAITNSKSFTIGGKKEYLTLPPFANLDSLAGVELQFWHQYTFGRNGKGYIEYYAGNGVWNKLGNYVNYGTNWTNLVNPAQEFIGHNGNWVQTSYPLDPIIGNGEEIIRFVSETDAAPGWAIDDINIYVPKQNSASPAGLASLEPPKAGKNDFLLFVQNTAAQKLTKVEVEVYVDGVLRVDSAYNFSPLDPGKTRFIPTPISINLTQSSTAIMVVTKKPNNRIDEKPNDDTLHLPLTILPDLASLPYCYDFENSDELIPFDGVYGIYDTNWVRGIPAKSNINGNGNSSNSWYTNANENYDSLLHVFLYSPVMPVLPNSCYSLSLLHNYDTEYNFDGGNIEYRTNTNSSWKTLGSYGDSTWYNTPYLQSLVQVQPGFSGNSNGWLRDSVYFKTLNEDSLQFRIQFASNANISGNGWAVDNICLKPTPSHCSGVALDEFNKDNSVFKLYPSPARHSLVLELSQNKTLAHYNAAIYDIQGNEIQRIDLENCNLNHFTVNIQRLAAGIYLVGLQDETGAFIIQKFIKE